MSQYDDEGQKNKFEDEIKKFEEIFSNKKLKLIMITQSNPNGKKYDIAFLHQYEDGKYQFILVQVTRRKEKKEMRQYTNVKCDCYSFANFFALFNDIRLKRYHFAFIFQGGYNQNKQNMFFCIKHNIKFFKFVIKNNSAFFLNSRNIIIKDLVFNKESNSLVDLIDDSDNSSSSDDCNLLGKKRNSINSDSKAKYVFGVNVYKKVLDILDCKKFELSDYNYGLSENQYFYIYYTNETDRKRIYYLVYLKKGKKLIKCLNKDKDAKINKNVTEKDLNKSSVRFICFRIIE